MLIINGDAVWLGHRMIVFQNEPARLESSGTVSLGDTVVAQRVLRILGVRAVTRSKDGGYLIIDSYGDTVAEIAPSCTVWLTRQSFGDLELTYTSIEN